MYIYTYVCIYIFTYVHVCIYVYKYMYLYVYLSMYEYIYICIYIHIFIYTYLHTHTRKHTHTYIWKQFEILKEVLIHRFWKTSPSRPKFSVVLPCAVLVKSRYSYDTCVLYLCTTRFKEESMCALWLCYAGHSKGCVYYICVLGRIAMHRVGEIKVFVWHVCTMYVHLMFHEARRVYMVYVHYASPYAIQSGVRTIYVFLCVLLCAVSVKSRCFLLYVCTMRVVICRNMCTKYVLRAGAYSDAPCWWNHVSLLTCVLTVFVKVCVLYIYMYHVCFTEVRVCTYAIEHIYSTTYV